MDYKILEKALNRTDAAAIAFGTTPLLLGCGSVLFHDHATAAVVEKREIEDNVLFREAFEWRFEFPEVLDDEGDFVGFDVVIANPPYIRQEEIKDFKPHFAQRFETYVSSADLYVYFVELGMGLLRKQGSFCYIIPNKWMRAGYGATLRSWLHRHDLRGIVDFGDLPVFEEATTYPCILSIAKQSGSGQLMATEISTLDMDDLGATVKQLAFQVATDSLADGGWTLMRNDKAAVLEKIRSQGVPLGEYVGGKIYRGVLTGLNEAFVIDGATRDRLIAEDARSAEVIKPFLAGREIKRYQFPEATSYLLFVPWHFPLEADNTISGVSDAAETAFEKQFPAVYKHLLGHKSELLKRNKDETGIRYEWYALQRAAATYRSEMEAAKIVWPEVGIENTACFVEEGIFLNKTTFFIPSNDRFLLGILNH